MHRNPTISMIVWPSYSYNELRKCIQQYYHTTIKENCNDPKNMWKTVNKGLNKDSASFPILIANAQDRVLD